MGDATLPQFTTYWGKGLRGPIAQVEASEIFPERVT